MLQERRRAIQEEVGECENSLELEAIVRHWDREYAEAIEDQQIMCWVNEKRQEFASMPPIVEDHNAKIRELFSQIHELESMPPQPRVPVQRTSRKYKLLKTEVTWSTKPQVLAIMHIIAAHAVPGDVLDEDDIVNMMVANENVLQTRQGGKRIWDYYKGTHNEGLVAHGHFERI